MDRTVQRRLAASFHVARKGRFRAVLFVCFAGAALAWAFLERRRRRG
jgi:hypothetical protein